MALTPGTAIPGTTTLSAFIDMVYANRVNLPAGTEVITAVDPVRAIVSWPTVNNGDNVVAIYLSGRQLPGATVAV